MEELRKELNNRRQPVAVLQVRKKQVEVCLKAVLLKNLEVQVVLHLKNLEVQVAKVPK